MTGTYQRQRLGGPLTLGYHWTLAALDLAIAGLAATAPASGLILDLQHQRRTLARQRCMCSHGHGDHGGDRSLDACSLCHCPQFACASTYLQHNDSPRPVTTEAHLAVRRPWNRGWQT